MEEAEKASKYIPDSDEETFGNYNNMIFLQKGQKSQHRFRNRK
jgi:hypothetical protein